jgi:glycosyltransferase involved in cell wall biosynthesis
LRISVIIPVFNGERTVGAAIDSVLAQEFAGTEIVVTNDGSTDSTQRILDGYGSRIKVIEQPNVGACAARNAGVAVSSGKHLAFLDADDLFLPGKLEKSYQALEENPHAALAFSDLVMLDEEGREIESPPIGRAPSMDDLLECGWAILPSGTVMPRTVFDRCGGFCEEFQRSVGGDDPYMWMIAREQGEFIYIPERLASHLGTHIAKFAWKYQAGGEVFKRLVRARYGRRAQGLLRWQKRFMSTLFVASAMSLMDRGDLSGSVSAWFQSVRYRPAILFDPWMISRVLVPQNLRRLARGLATAATRQSNLRVPIE